MYLFSQTDAVSAPPSVLCMADEFSFFNQCQYLVNLSCDAMMTEVLLTPKPGLVDQANNGAHHDMDISLFRHSILAIRCCLPDFVHAGYTLAHLAPVSILPELRKLGVLCEKKMYQATAGVNTHKGAVFAFGLLCAAGGRLLARRQKVTVTTVCAEVAAICEGLTHSELAGKNEPTTAGERVYASWRIPGARGEAESGFALARTLALPAYQACRQAGWHKDRALLHALLLLMASNDDTNLISRGGMEGLRYVQNAAYKLLLKGGCARSQSLEWLREFDRDLTGKNLSPGGSADLLAVTWFLAHLPAEN